MDEANPEQTLRINVTELLQGGPLALPELVQHLDTRGQLDWLRDDDVREDEIAGALVDCVVVTDEIWSGPARLALSSHLTEGLVLTHRLQDEEVERQEVEVTPDLVLLDWNVAEALRLGPDALLKQWPGEHVPGEDHSFVAGPDGWLSGFLPGDVVAFVRNGDSVRVSSVTDLANDEHEMALLREAVDYRIPPGTGEEAVPLLLDALTLDPTAFREPVRPLGELLEAAGMERRGFSFGRAGEEWSSFSEQWRDGSRRDTLAKWGISGCCEDAFDEARTAYDGIRQGVVPDVRAVTRSLAHGAVAPALAEYVMDTFANDEGELVAFAELIASGGEHRAAPARLMLALEAQERGDLVTAEIMLRRSLRADPEYAPAAFILVDYEIDRGHVDAAIALLRHSDLGEGDVSLEFLEDLRAASGALCRGVGRNDPCPCGSGRKFKACCQDQKRSLLSTRTGLLMHKLARFASNEAQQEIVVEVAYAATDPNSPDQAAAAFELSQDPIIMDIALWEGGIADDYLVSRGDLLPEDERDLIGELIENPRKLCEITAVDSGRSLTLRDTASGEVVTVNEQRGSIGREPGEFILARLAQLTDVTQIMGVVVHVPLRLRASVLELVDLVPDMADLAAWYGMAIAPPRVVNRAGELTMFCRVELAGAGEASEVASVLNEILEPTEDGEWIQWWDHLGDGDRVIGGVVRTEEETLIIEAYSRERCSRLVELVCGMLPHASVVNETITEVGRTRPDPSERAPASASAVDPAMQGLVEQIMRQKEEEWVEESIPALDGLTPRQALADLTRREDLFALLREFEGYGVAEAGAGGVLVGGGFNVQRLRTLLGID